MIHTHPSKSAGGALCSALTALILLSQPGYGQGESLKTDRFSVHVAPDGGGRTTVFNDFASDRKPDNVFLLGVPRAPIDALFMVSTPEPAGQALQAVAFDDFYLSPENTLLSTLPVPSGFGKVPLGPPKVTDVRYDSETEKVTLTWNSRPDETYAVFFSETLTPPFWEEANDGVPSGGIETVWELEATYPENKLFFKVQPAE